jgi:hypothetical protein
MHARTRSGTGAALRPAALLLLILIPFLAVGAAAQQRNDPEAVGQAKANVATARGISALHSNVGGLALDPLGPRDDLPGVELDFTPFPVGASAGSTYLNPSSLDFVFSSKTCGAFSEVDRQRLQELLEPGRLDVDAAMDLLALRFRIPGIVTLGLKYGHQVRARLNLPDNFRENVLGNGDPFAGTQVFKGAEVGGEWLRTLSVSLAGSWNRPVDSVEQASWFPSIGFGASLGSVDGMVHFDSDPASQITTQNIPSPAGATYRTIQVSGFYNFRSSEPEMATFRPADAILKPGFSSTDTVAGRGWSGSLGVSVVLLRMVPTVVKKQIPNPLEPGYNYMEVDTPNSRDALFFGFSVEEIGKVVWNGRNLARNPVILDTVSDTLTAINGGVSSIILCRYQGKLDTIGSFETSLPTKLRMGLGMDLTAFVPEIPGDFLINLEGAFDLNDAIGSEGRPRLSIGADWRITDGFSLRSGIQFGGRLGSAVALGLGFRPASWLSIDLATSEVNSLFDLSRKRADAALGMGTQVRF